MKLTALAPIAITAGLTLTPATPTNTAGVHANTYPQAYTACATQGWDTTTVNQCRWAAYIHFGGTLIAAHHPNTNA